MSGTRLVKTVIERSLIPLNSILLFFVIFEPLIVLPAWLQVFGRMHPLALHFPIVLVLIYAMLCIFFPARLRKEHWFTSATDGVLVGAAFTASITALMGFALSGSEGYDPDALALHKWTGVFIPFILYVLYAFRKGLLKNIHVTRGIAFCLTALIILAGHHGAVITHGENFLLAPITPVQTRVIPAFEDAVIYTDLVQPILEDKCMSCHNTKKAKGDLVMDDRELFLKGGEDGIPWDTTKNDLGIMMRMINLPMDEKEHMPPKGKPQLTDDEKFILHEWIKNGSGFENKFIDLLPSDTLYAIGKKKLPSSSEELYDFPAADEKQITKLNNDNRVVTPIAIGSPALSATFYNRSAFNISSIKELAPLNDNIVELNVPKMEVKDEDLNLIKQFKNLRRLNLNFTSITGKTLEQLQSLPHLKMIALSGTQVDYSNLRKLQTFPKLKTVYLWSTPAADEKLDELAEKNKNITYHAGFTGDTVLLQLTPPVLENEDHILTKAEDLKLKHYIGGAEIRYTFDGSDPDSLTSPVFKPGLKIDSNVTLKAKAFKKGWISSEILQQHFYKKTHIPDSVQLLTQPDSSFIAKKGATLNDNEKSDVNFSSGKWLGFEKNDLVAVLRFKQPVVAHNVTLGVLLDLDRRMFLPAKIEVWGGDAPGKMKLLGSMSPQQPKENEPDKLVPVQCKFPQATIRYMKLIVKPVRSIPKWHPEKSQKAIFLVDEVFVN